MSALSLGKLVLGIFVGYLLGRSTRVEVVARSVDEPEDGRGAPVAEEASGRDTGGPDDLTRIEGIGPKIRDLLRGAGITSFAALAETQVASLEQILAEAGARYRLHDPATWPEQAALAAAGRAQELAALQQQLRGGRRA